MNMTKKKDLDEIIRIAPMMAIMTTPAVVRAAAFCTAQDMANKGDNEGAMYLLKNYPRLGADTPSEAEMDSFLKSLLED